MNDELDDYKDEIYNLDAFQTAKLYRTYFPGDVVITDEGRPTEHIYLSIHVSEEYMIETMFDLFGRVAPEVRVDMVASAIAV